MNDWLKIWLPNLMDKLPAFYESILETLAMFVWAGAIAFSIGLVLGVLLVLTRKGGIASNTFFYQLLDKVINFFRSIPFIILLAGLIPLTRIISGTAIGVSGAIVPLVFGTVPFYARQIEAALLEVQPGVIEAAKAMGASPMRIIFGVYLRECVPGIVRATTITSISLIGLTAMAGVVGAGGLGDFAIRFGHQRNQLDITYASVLVLVAMVCVIQFIGNWISKRATH